MDFSSRLKELRKKNAITQENLAKIIRVERSSIGKYEASNVMPSIDVLNRIAEYFNVSVDYLLGKEKSPAESGTAELFKTYSNVRPIQYRSFPVLGKIACGKPKFADEERETIVLADTDIDADFILYADGDSMTGARIMPGDIVFIKKQPIVENGDIAAVIIGDEATLKRVYYYPDKNKLVLNPENPKYEPLVYIGEELNSIRILGKAVAFQSVVR